MTSICPTCGHADAIISHRPFAHIREIRYYCAGCGQRVHNYKPGPRGLGKVLMTREPPKPPVNATHPVKYYPPSGRRLYIKGRDPDRRPAEDVVTFKR